MTRAFAFRMTAEPRGPIDTEIPPGIVARRAIGGFVARYWAWMLLGLALAIFAVTYLPALLLSMFGADFSQPPLFYKDVVLDHHSAGDWLWSPANSLFPDLIVFFTLRFLAGEDWLAMDCVFIFFFVSWIATCAWLIRAFRRPHALGLMTLLALLIFGEACDFPGLGLQSSFFQQVFHAGACLLTFTCLGFFISHISGYGRTAGFVALLVLSFLIGISDFLFLVDFVVPATITAVLIAIMFRRQWKRHLQLAAGIIGVGVAAFFSARHLFPAPTRVVQFTTPNWDSAKSVLGIIGAEMKDPGNHWFVFMIALDVVIVLGVTAWVIALCFSKEARKVPAPIAAALLFSAGSICGNWTAVIFTGTYQDMTENRYLVVALNLPFFLFVFGLHGVINWRPWLEKGFATAAAVFISVCAFIPLPPCGEYSWAMQLIPFLQKTMKDRHIEAGLSTFWHSNLITFLSHGTVPMRSIASDGSLAYFANSLQWYGKDRPPGEGPHFRLVLPESPDDERARFGPPDEVLTAPDGTTVWIYSEAHAIVYNKYFNMLSNRYLDGGRTMHINAIDLPASTGDGLNTSRIGHPGDNPFYLTYGPYVVLAPGRYRAVYHYQYLSAPDPALAPTYDLLVHDDQGEKSYHRTLLPYQGTQPAVFVDEFTVTRPDLTYEMRIFFNGSGILRVDSLDVTSLGD
jgi:hypothetical protein